MDTAAHTPGPWKAHPTGLARSGLPEFEIHWSDIGECVAEIVHGEPDARLIAAAPELLDALQAARKSVGANRDALYESHYQPHTGDADAEGKIAVGAEDALLEQIDAAIAKATGNSA